jgi:hypothetical protein
MGRLRRRKTGLAWLIAVAFLFSSLGVAFSQGLARKTSPIVDAVLGAIVICTADGASADGHGGAPPVHDPSRHCPACLMFAKVALAVALVLLAIGAFALMPPPRPAGSRTPRAAASLSLGGIGSRAPPFFA